MPESNLSHIEVPAVNQPSSNQDSVMLALAEAHYAAMCEALDEESREAAIAGECEVQQ